MIKVSAFILIVSMVLIIQIDSLKLNKLNSYHQLAHENLNKAEYKMRHHFKKVFSYMCGISCTQVQTLPKEFDPLIKFIMNDPELFQAALHKKPISKQKGKQLRNFIENNSGLNHILIDFFKQSVKNPGCIDSLTDQEQKILIQNVLDKIDWENLFSNIKKNQIDKRQIQEVFNNTNDKNLKNKLQKCKLK